MSDAEQEPSMEEILASIRSIITDDEEKSSPAAAEPAEVEQAAAEPAEVEQAAVEQETVALEEQKVEPREELDDDDEVLDLTDMDAADPEPLFEQQAYQTAQPEPVHEPVANSSTMPPPISNFDNDLVSLSPAAETIGEFAKLGEKLYESSNELPIGNGAITLEHLTRELVRPMLKQWLDQHLPMTVERLVREEIERLVMQSQRKDPW